MISPIKIEGDKIRARCYTSNRVKIFLIAKIELVENSAGNTSYTGEKVVEPRTIKEAFIPHVSSLKNLGWCVVLEAKSISLFSHFKNGKLRKTPDIACEFHEYIIDYGVTMDDGNLIDEERLSSRPYYVYSKHSDNDESHFKYLSKAVILFCDYAKEGANRIVIKG